jgi:hypothetical protein
MATLVVVLLSPPVRVANRCAGMNSLLELLETSYQLYLDAMIVSETA